MLGQVIDGPRIRNNRKKYRVRWDRGMEGWYPEYLLEVANHHGDPLSLLAKGRFGRAEHLRRTLTHLQLSGRLANIVYSMYATNTTFYAYQYKPVLAMLDSPSRGLLVADEVGLGKTIEAGLIWTELRARYDARRLVVVCPAMLRSKWCFELESKFGVTAYQVDAAELAQELAKRATPMAKALVCSLEGLRPPKGWQDASQNDKSAQVQLAHLLNEAKVHRPCIDLLVIDEAHKLRNPRTQTAKLGRLLRGVSDHVVLLSATPVNNKSDDLYQLLNLLDPDFFSSRAVFPQVLSANAPLLRARSLALDLDASGDSIRSEIFAALDHPLLCDNQQLQTLAQESRDDAFPGERANRVEIADRLERANLLRHVVTRTRKREVTGWKIVRSAECLYVTLAPREAKFYNRVTDSIRRYAQNRDIADGFLLSVPQRQMSSCMYAAAKAWTTKVANDDDDITDFLYEAADVTDGVRRDVGPLIRYLVSDVLSDFDYSILRDFDSKFGRFENAVQAYLDKHPRNKIVVFSYFKATLRYLAGRLAHLAIPAQILHGSIRGNKQDVIDRFETSCSDRVLLTSEVASEGVDLQFSSVLVNYDLPWNPMKIEQRIGRLDRIGQKADKVLIRNFCYKDTIDERIYTRLLEKLKIFEKSLGGMEIMLGDKVAALTSDLMCHQLTPEEEAKTIDRALVAIEAARREEKRLEAEAGSLIAHGGFVLAQVNASRDFGRHVAARDLRLYVQDYLSRYAKGFTFRESDVDARAVDVRLPRDAADRLKGYMHRKQLGQTTRLADGHQVTCWFSARRRRSHKQEEVTHLHPLIRFISHEVRNDALHYVPPLVAISLSVADVGDVVEGTYVFSLQQWVFKGIRAEEELRVRAFQLDAGLLDPDRSWRLVNAAKGAGVDWLSADQDVERQMAEDALEACTEQLEEDYDHARRRRKDENEDRIRFRIWTAERGRTRELRTQLDMLERQEANGQMSQARMTVGRIKALQRRFDSVLEELRGQQEFRSEPAVQVCAGVIRVGNLSSSRARSTEPVRT